MWNDRRFIIIGIAVGVLLVSYGSLYFFYLSPKKEEISLLKKEIQTEQAMVEALTERYENIKNNPYDEQELLLQLPPSPMMDQILLDLEKVEKTTQSQIETFIIHENSNSEHEDLEKVTFDLQVSSNSYKGFIRFLSELQKLSRINQIESLNFQSSSGDKFLFSLSISMFYYPQQEEEILQGIQ